MSQPGFNFKNIDGNSTPNAKLFMEINIDGIEKENVKENKNNKKAKIKKIVYMSGLGVSLNSSVGYFISKYNAEKTIINSGLNYETSENIRLSQIRDITINSEELVVSNQNFRNLVLID